MLDWIKTTIESAGYPGIVLLMVAENVLPPIPSELIMPFAGYLAADGKLTYVGVVVAGAVGSVLGALPLYYLGRAVGADRLQRWADRHGHWLMLSGDDIQRAHKWFGRYGSAAVLLGRLVPGIRSLVSIPAGIEGMSLPLFLFLTALGTGIWAGFLAYMGWMLGEQFDTVGTYVGPVSYLVLGGLLAWYLIYVFRRRRERDRRAATWPD